MTLQQLGATALIAVAIIAGWIYYSLERSFWRRIFELYLWLIPVSLAWLTVIRTSVGLETMIGVAAVHFLLVALGVSVLGGKGQAPIPQLRVAGVLLILGSTLLWIGANTFPGVELEDVQLNLGTHLLTTGLFFAGSAITLAGLTTVTAVLRQKAHSVLGELGLIAFLAGFIFWSLHLAFRAVVMVGAAGEFADSGSVPTWYMISSPWSGVVYGLYMTMAFLAIAAYAGALLSNGLIGKMWGYTSVAFGLIAAAAFPTAGLFDLPLIPQFGPFLFGVVLLRRSYAMQLSAAQLSEDSSSAAEIIAAKRARVGRTVLVTGWIALVAALVIRHEFTTSLLRDPGIYPATIFTAFVVWKPRWWLFPLATIGIAFPVLNLIEWTAFSEPEARQRFLSQSFLLLAGILAIGGGVRGMWQKGASGPRLQHQGSPS